MTSLKWPIYNDQPGRKRRTLMKCPPDVIDALLMSLMLSWCRWCSPDVADALLMSLLILDAVLSRPTVSVPWGFRMIGGSDHGCTFTVERVVPGGVAAMAGVQVDDVILSCNGIPLEDNMTHEQACQVILSATLELHMQLQRIKQFDFIKPPRNTEEDMAVQISQRMLVEYMKRLGQWNVKKRTYHTIVTSYHACLFLFFFRCDTFDSIFF